MAHITVSIQPGRYPSKHDTTAAIPLSAEIAGEVYRTIDAPSADAGVEAMFCTPAVERVTVMQSRADAAKVISAAITNALLDSMYARDTVMGYPRK